MATRQLPDAELLRKLLRYDPETGKLYWRERTPDMMDEGQLIDRAVACRNWNNRFADKEAMNSRHCMGYLRGTLLCRNELAHRVVWKIVTGEEPNHIDHINGVRTDNRWCNLRSISKAENAKNVRQYRPNVSGCHGVRQTPSRKWQAHIVVNRKQLHIGTFATREDAIRARKAAERKYGFHPNHGSARA